jgi:hypothetical protein
MLQKYLGFQNHGVNAHLVAEEKVRALVRDGVFYLGVCEDEEKTPIVMLGWFVDKEKNLVTLFSSKTNYEYKLGKSYVSRVISLAHYEGMLYFKALGIKEYDFGGFYMSDTETERNRKHLSVSEFKQSFGGYVTNFRSGIIIRLTDTKRTERNMARLLPLMQDKDVILWGMALMGQFALVRLRQKGIFPKALVDNKLAIEDDKYCRQDVLKEYDPKTTIILVATTFPTFEKILKEDVCTPFAEQNAIYCLCENEMGEG